MMIKPRLLTIQTRWEQFASQVLPPNASETQHTEMRRAFFAGCAEMLLAAQNEVTQLPEDDAIASMQAWRAELDEFFGYRGAP